MDPFTMCGLQVAPQEDTLVFGFYDGGPRDTWIMTTVPNSPFWCEDPVVSSKVQVPAFNEQTSAFKKHVVEYAVKAAAIDCVMSVERHETRHEEPTSQEMTQKVLYELVINS